MSSFDLDHFLTHITTHPGVYRMFDKHGKIIYIGKAKNLKIRVSSYFQKGAKDTKTMHLVSQIAFVEVTITPSDYEAFLLESNLIKKHRPRYNILFKDDKSYPYLVLSHHAFPGIYGFRGKPNKKDQYFGPYVSLSSVKETLKLLQKTFLVRQCQDSFYRSRSRPCMQYQIKRCLAPCVGYVTEEDYHLQVSLLKQFLEGELNQVLTKVSDKMEASAQEMSYERAAIYRDQLVVLRKLQEQQVMSTQASGLMDVFGVVKHLNTYALVLLQVSNGDVVGDAHWFLENQLEEESENVLESLLSHYYLTNESRTFWPNQVILPKQFQLDPELLETISKRAGRSISWIYHPRGIKQKLQKLAEFNAESKLNAKFSEKLSHQERLKDLSELLHLDELPHQIECFDISHFQGEETLASCVVMNQQGIDKSSYRKFKIAGITPGDDYAAIRQAVQRRLKRAIQDENIPDILVIDGGKGQYKQAYEVLDELNLLQKIVLLSLGKGPERISGDEDLFFALDKDPLRLADSQPGFLLLRQLRDEAHRFAITGQRGAVAKQRGKSVLESVPGVGAKRKKALLMHFGGWQELEKASIDEIKKVEGVSERLAELIWHSLR